MTSKNSNNKESESPYIAKTKIEQTFQKLRELMKEETRMVKGVFKCFETPGSSQEVYVKKYPTSAELREKEKKLGVSLGEGIEPFKKTMMDGMVYEIPLYVARHLNGTDVTAGALGDPNHRNPNIGTCSYPVHGFKWDRGQEAPRGLETAVPGLGMSTVVPLVSVSKRVQRFGFQSLDFTSALA